MLQNNNFFFGENNILVHTNKRSELEILISVLDVSNYMYLLRLNTCAGKNRSFCRLDPMCEGKGRFFFHLTKHSTHFIYSFTGVRPKVMNDQSDSKRENLLPPLYRLLFLNSSKGSFICTIP